MEAVVKVRTGPPSDKDEDKNLNVWAGVIPYSKVLGITEEYIYPEG